MNPGNLSSGPSLNFLGRKQFQQPFVLVQSTNPMKFWTLDIQTGSKRDSVPTTKNKIQVNSKDRRIKNPFIVREN